MIQFIGGLVLAGATILCAQGQGSLRLTNMTHTPAGVSFSWNSAGTNYVYTLQGRSALTNELWLPLAAPQPWPTTLTAWTNVPPNATSYFYRVIAVTNAVRGRLLSSTLGVSYSQPQLTLMFNAAGIPLAAQYGVKVYKLVYETIDPLGARTQASAALCVPAGASGSLPLLSYEHGTLTQTNTAPSSAMTSTSGEVMVGAAFASAGYVSVLPDYLGMGSSPGFHPYLHARSEATASVDALRAGRAYCASNSISLSGKLFICGYSQGGHSALALHRELETYHTNEFTLTASAPMSGPYDLSGATMDDMLSGRVPPNPYYLAYIVDAYQHVYGLAPGFADLLTPPYNSTVPPLFDGNHAGSAINAALPAIPLNILKPELAAAFRNDPNQLLRQALRDNDLLNWRPRAPLRLYHCSGDLDVIPANATNAWSSFQAQGATQVESIDPSPGADHVGCVYPSVLGAKAWFDTLR
jgi:hypothetical protein